jgi:peptide/nickel transport system substrate-binding protein
MMIIIGSVIWWGISLYRYFTVPVPTYGGQYIEAFVGQPRYINPLLAHSSSTDRSLSQLIFSRLFDYDENGILQPDLVERFDVSDDAKEYTIYLKKNVQWHDDQPFTADDVVYTTGVAQDIAYGAVGVSNETRLLWQNVDVEKVDDFTVKFVLSEPNSMFLHNLNMGILPKHIWENISPEQFQLSEFNQKPIGTGPYEFVDYDVDDNGISSYILRANKSYYDGEPYITRFTVNFYATRDEAVVAYHDGKVSGIIVDKKEHVDFLQSNAKKESIELPHYFAVFFNQTKSVPLAYDEVREALSRATDRKAIIENVFGEDADVRRSPFADGVVGYNADKQQTGFDRDGANVLLEEKGWKKGDDGIRAKDGARLSITVHISANQPQSSLTAELLKEQWREVGAEVNIQEHEKDDLEKNIIQPRDYDALLYAHQMRFEPDLLPLWHSREKNDPGMNYALFADKNMDEALDNFAKTKDINEQNSYYTAEQEALQKEVPAVFLFAPRISFMHSDKIKGVNVRKVNVSYDRYTNVHKWFVKEKRIKK